MLILIYYTALLLHNLRHTTESLLKNDPIYEGI